LNTEKELEVGSKVLCQDLVIHVAKHIKIMGNQTKDSGDKTPPPPSPPHSLLSLSFHLKEKEQSFFLQPY